MAFAVTKISEGPIKPAVPTPTDTLPLAWVDRYPTHRGLVESMHIYRSGTDPAKVIREAVAKALVYFYPLAGRIVEPVPGSPAIECSSNGVYFAEAAANCTLEDVRHLERPMMLAREDLVPYPTAENWSVEPHNTIMMIQVTTFTCGGFVVGLRFNHASADGMGAALFMSAVGDLARGLEEPKIKPVWDREKYPNPSIKPGPLPDVPVLALEYVAIDFPTAYIDKIKSEYMAAYPGKFCSGFEVLTAKLWKCRTLALKLAPDANVRLGFFAGVRHLLKLDRGYYGNSIFPVRCSTKSEDVLNASIVEIIDMIRQAKDRMAEELFRWAKDEVEEDPFQMTFNYESLYVSDWSKLGFSEVDYGFGKPMVVGPIVNVDFVASVIVLKAPVPLDGTRMLASCVVKEHVEEFVRLMKEDLE